MTVTGNINLADVTNKVKFQNGVTATAPKPLNSIANLKVELPDWNIIK